MKLPNFLVSDDLNRLKSAMGISSETLGNVRFSKVRRLGVTLTEDKVLKTEGLPVEEKDVVPLPDGTLSYKNRRVLLYIRDVAQFGGNDTDRKFHVSDCTTLRQMRANLQFGKFVIASRDDGLFKVHYINSGVREDKPLDVCQNCLDRLKYKGFQASMGRGARLAAVQKFSIADFFVAYPKTLHHAMPNHTERTAPTNDYARDFSQRSRAHRERKNWVCEVCGISLSREGMQRYLHVHHINGLKNENHDENLKAVCVHCHALEPSHAHIRATPQYPQFETIWQTWRRTGAIP